MRPGRDECASLVVENILFQHKFKDKYLFTGRFNKTLTICTLIRQLCKFYKIPSMKPLSNSKSLIILIKCKNIFIKVGVCYMDFHAFYPGGIPDFTDIERG